MKHWKRMLLSLTLTAGLLATAAPVMAAPQEAALKVNDQKVTYAGNSPVIEKGTTLVPLKATLQAMDIELKSVKDGSIHISIDGKETSFEGNTQVIDGVTYAPIRVVGEAAGYEVRWDQGSRTVLLVSKETGQGARGYLWEVEHNGNTVHLVGSMHIADDSFYPLRAEFEEAFAEADYLGVEVDVSKAAEEEQQQLVLSIGMYQDGTTLKDHISAESYAKLGEILKQFGLEANAFDTFKPWVVESTLATLKSMNAGYEGSAGIDLYFIQKAVERKMPVIELESFESQLSMFDGFSKELQEKNLKATLDNFDVIEDGVDQMANMWKTGNDDELLAFTESFSEDPEYVQAMLIDRNIDMVDKIEGYLKSDKKEEYFIVVGAAHYLGEHGIVTLLEEKGYTVVRK